MNENRNIPEVDIGIPLRRVLQTDALAMRNSAIARTILLTIAYQTRLIHEIDDDNPAYFYAYRAYELAMAEVRAADLPDTQNEWSRMGWAAARAAEILSGDLTVLR